MRTNPEQQVCPTSLSVVHVVPDLTMGGAERMLERLAAAHAGSARFRHEVISLRSEGSVGPILRRHGVTVTTLGISNPLAIVGALGKLVTRFRRDPPDIVHAWMYHANLLAGVAAKIAGVPKVIWAIRTTDVGRRAGTAKMTVGLRCLGALLSGKLPTAIVYVANSARRSHEAVGYAQSKGMIIPNGYTEPESFDRDRIRAELGIPRDALVIGSVGRFNAAKAPEDFVAAAARVAAVSPRTFFLMAGRGCDPTNAELAGRISGNGLSGRFLLLGERSDIERVFAALDMFCLHSRTEAFPNVVAEAMIAGIPCAVTDVGDAADVVGREGIVVSAGQPEAMANALLKLTRLDPDQRDDLGRRARARIRSEFSIANVIGRYEALYTTLMDVPPGGRVRKS